MLVLRAFLLSLGMRIERGAKAWFASKAKSIDIVVEDFGKKLKGCIWERCKGRTSWVRFGDFSLKKLLLGVEDCDKISKREECASGSEEEGRRFNLSRRSNKAGTYLLCSVRDVDEKRFS